MTEHPIPLGPDGPDDAPVHVLVVHDDKSLAVRVNRLLRRDQADTEVYACIDLTRIDEAIADDGPFEVIVAGPTMATPEGLTRLQSIHESDPTTYLVLLFDAEHPDVELRDVIRTGAEDYLPEGSADTEIVDAMRRAVETAAERRERRAAPAPPADETSPSGSIYTVCSATGGCGKTFFSTNLAYFLAQRSQGRVVLVDLDLQFGEVGPTLRLRPKATISTLLDSDLLEPTPGEVVELGEIEEYLTDTEDGIQVLAAPKDPVEADRVKPREVGKVLTLLAERFDYVVVDTPTGLTELVLAALDLSDRLFVLASLDVMSVRNLRVFLQTLSRLQISSENVSLILNKEEKGIGIDVDDVERFFDRGFEAILPYSRDVPRSMNSGVPVLATEPKSRVSRRLVRTYEPYLPPELRDTTISDEDERPGLLARIAAAERIDDAADEPPETDESASEPTADDEPAAPAAEDDAEPTGRPRAKRRTSGGKLAEVKRAVRTRVLEELAPRLSRGESLDEQEMHEEITTLLDEVLAEWPEKVPTRDREAVLRELVSDMLGYGPLDPLLADPTVTEVMVNAYDDVWVEREGKMFETDVAFNDETQFRNVIEKIVAGVGRRIDESSPMVDARLPNGSRVNAIIPPLAIHGPVLTIRKFAEDPYTAQDLIGFGTLTMDMATVLQACVEGKLNVLVSGGTATGKTTLLNVLSSFIPEGDRIVTIEDAAELQLQQRHVINLESRPPNAEGKGEVTIRDLVRNALRMRPDRIVVGEVRGGEALDMLQAMNTGHEGSLTTVHANSSRDALFRLEMLVMMAGYELPIRAIRENIAAALDLIVQLERLRDGTRVVTSVQEIHGMEGDTIVLQELFTYTGELTDAGRQLGELKPTGLRPKFMERLQAEGVELDPKMFRKAPARSSSKKKGSSRKKGGR